MRRVNQAVLSLLPAEAVPVGPIAVLVEGPEGGVVFVLGMATFAFDAGDEVGRRLAAVQLVSTDIASAVADADAFDVTPVTLWRWRWRFEADGVNGLMVGQTGPKGPHKLTEQIITRVRELDGQGLSLAAVGKSGRDQHLDGTRGVGPGETAAGRPATQAPTDPDPYAGGADGGDRLGAMLAVVPMPAPRAVERALARAGELRSAA